MGRLKELFHDLAAFTVRERRGILWFIPIAIVASVVIGSLTRPSFEQGLQVAADNALENRRTPSPAAAGPQAAPETEFFPFDPNTIDYRGLRRLGFTSRAAAGILKFRESGKIFRIPEDFAACWDVGDSIFFTLEPYIRIAPRFAVKKRSADASEATISRPVSGERPAARRDSLREFDPNLLTAGEFQRLGFSVRQAEAIVNHRAQLGGFRTVAEFGECYVVRGTMFERLEPYVRIAPPAPKTPQRVDLNTADSASLVALRGIGALTAGRIAAYRTRLGGFVRAEQLAEIKGMTEENYERIVQQIFVDSGGIQKIDINFAAPEKLSGHPYISPEMLRRIVKNRQLKGGWSTTEEMIHDGTITEAQAARLAPYLKFNTNP